MTPTPSEEVQTLAKRLAELVTTPVAPVTSPADQEPAGPEAFIGVKDAADFLGIPTNTCYKLALSRILPSYKIGKLRRFRRSELAEAVEAFRVASRDGGKR